MTTTLTLGPFGRAGSGPALSDHDHVFQYDLVGLPQGQSASAAEMQGSRWKILRTQNGVQKKWIGDYETAEEALAMLQKEFDGSRRTLSMSDPSQNRTATRPCGGDHCHLRELLVR